MSESSSKSAVIYRQDYQPPSHLIDTVELNFRLKEEETLVTSKIAFRQNGAEAKGRLELMGKELELLSLKMDGQGLDESRYSIGESTLTIEGLPEEFTLEMEMRIHPEKNTALQGLYKSSGNFCTQCEAEGFRHICYFLDRPDVMARYRVRIEADKEKYPVLLSNGNRLESGELAGGRHYVQWEDPFPKPSYLFALVAGDLRCHKGQFDTCSGRTVDLEIWVEPENIERCEHALVSLQKSMRWDEERYGREYDLDIYMIVAVNDFNMGAMENKGLNIFNSKYVLADPETATDEDYDGIESVIGHEYFHNWTGNRVTCRDWFQLTLKEGLTVFRDQQFSAELNSAAVKRIDDVKVLRSVQFAEDRGPMAHSIRPEYYEEINNFYTSTVYNKGAEVIRMLHTLLGEEGFRRGSDLYFERHDGQAVTCDDFRAAMADANKRDLSQFEHWYLQAGTPVVVAEGIYDQEDGAYTLRLRQEKPRSLTKEDYLPRHMPIEVGFLGPGGNELTPSSKTMIEFSEEEEDFRFEGFGQKPVLSILRGFSSPVELVMNRSREDLSLLASHDSDSFSRWDAAQSLAQDVLLEQVESIREGSSSLDVDSLLLDTWGKILSSSDIDGSFRALLLELPDERVVGAAMEQVDVEAIESALSRVAQAIVSVHGDALLKLHAENRGHSYAWEGEGIDRRRSANAALDLLARGQHPESEERAWRQFSEADNMTDKEAALRVLVHLGGGRRTEALQLFHSQWKGNPLVLDKWFAVQAMSRADDALEQVEALIRHADFRDANPNRLRSLVGVFANRNQKAFHDRSGRGYQLLAEQVLATDSKNPQVAARLVSAFNQWRRFDTGRQKLQCEQLERIVDNDHCSKDVREIATRALA